MAFLSRSTPPHIASSLRCSYSCRVGLGHGLHRGRERSHGSQRPLISKVLTESAELAAGTLAPNFELLEPLTKRRIPVIEKGAPATLVMFLANHCKFVIHLKGEIAALARHYQSKGVRVVAISSSSIQTHPQDGPEKMVEDVQQWGYTFPYLYDETQEAAKVSRLQIRLGEREQGRGIHPPAYLAACTPEFYVFDKDLKLTYHGQFDDSRPSSNKPITGKDLRAALDATLSGLPPPKFRPSIGCNIKWHAGNEPAYFGAQVVKN